MRKEILGIAEYSVTPNSSLGLAFLDVGIQFMKASIMNTFIINWVWEADRLKFAFSQPFINCQPWEYYLNFLHLVFLP